MSGEKTLLIITGPTASGKSALAVEVAKRLSTEIISADSRQIYQGIPIVTAVPTPEQRREVAHHLVEVLPLDAYYSASMFETDAIRIAQDIFRRRDVAVVCGGSMMYVDALCGMLDELPTVSPRLRQGLMKEWKQRGDDWLREELKRLDPESFERMDLCNLKRVFHAVEISLEAGVPYSSLLGKARTARPFRIVKVAIEMEREQLFGRINRRVEMMMEEGLEEEARRVYPLRHLNSLNTVGLKEMFAYFDGEMDRESAIARIQKNTRVYAKKQMTWLKRDPSLRWLRNPSPSALIDELLLHNPGLREK